ncbi:MAG: bifunctional hydroxymethylpyrimidine kinase/phosphomethylpyrimidine kinase [Pseudomonadota bacterium]
MSQAGETDAPPPNILSIAGSDPSGGAGVQTDLKAIGAMGGYGMAALTALTAQNTRGVDAVMLAPPEFARAQIDAVFADVRVDAVKIGMIGSAAIAEAVAASLDAAGARNIVLDPVMVATSGDRLLDEDAATLLRARLAPMARVITPNTAEAAALLEDEEPRDRAAMAAAATRLLAFGPEAVLLKGGHLSGGESPDLLMLEHGPIWLEGVRIAGRPIHGGGCSLASALATALGHGLSLEAASRRAKAFVAEAITGADRLRVGSGARPLDHFGALLRRAAGGDG